nr:vegetative cell wall protein gp1-like [Aegilops tauschii subsp. strangulata]
MTPLAPVPRPPPRLNAAVPTPSPMLPRRTTPTSSPSSVYLRPSPSTRLHNDRLDVSLFPSPLAPWSRSPRPTSTYARARTHSPLLATTTAVRAYAHCSRSHCRRPLGLALAAATHGCAPPHAPAPLAPFAVHAVLAPSAVPLCPCPLPWPAPSSAPAGDRDQSGCEPRRHGGLTPLRRTETPAPCLARRGHRPLPAPAPCGVCPPARAAPHAHAR